MELLDLLTPDGAPTGRVKEKAAVHRDGDWHRAAHLWVVAPGRRVLLQRRALIKESWPGHWDVSVAGHVSAGETTLQAIVREAEEELGLVVEPDELRLIGTLRYQAVLHDGAYLENEFHDLFVLERAVDLASLRLDPAEVAEVAFVAAERLDAYDLVPHPESYARLRTVLR
jgi:isopentenyl-diphosphate delta-isomerase